MRAIAYFSLYNVNHSFDELKKQFEVYCENNLHQVIKIFCDKAANSFDSDKSYIDLVKYIENPKSSYLIIIPSIYHFGNDLESVIRKVCGIELLGAKVICANDDFPDPIQNSLNQLDFGNVSKSKSENIKNGMISKALQGKVLGRPPYGYRQGVSGDLEVVDDESSLVKLLFQKYVNENTGLRKLAAFLNKEKYQTRRGKEWNVLAVRHILKNPVYTGTYIRYGFRLPKSHLPIIDSSIYRQAQDLMKKKYVARNANNVNPFLLSGLIYCYKCGEKMMGVTRRQRWKKSDGQINRNIYRYYQCQTKNSQGTCNYVTWNEDKLEDLVALKVNELLSKTPDKSFDAYLKKKIENENLDVKNAERNFYKAVNKVARGQMNLLDINKYIIKLDYSRRSGSDNNFKSDFLNSNFHEIWPKYDLVTKRSFLFNIIAKILVKKNSIEIIS